MQNLDITSESKKFLSSRQGPNQSDANLDQYGFDYDKDLTEHLREISEQSRLRQDGTKKVESRRKQFFKASGMFFVNRNNDL